VRQGSGYVVAQPLSGGHTVSLGCLGRPKRKPLGWMNGEQTKWLYLPTGLLLGLIPLC
jgi:hypothetical protein